MTQFNTFRIPCRSTCVADHVDIVRLGRNTRSARVFFADFQHVSKCFHLGSMALCFLHQCLVQSINSNDDQILYLLRIADILHFQHLLRVVGSAENRRHLRLVQDVFNL